MYYKSQSVQQRCILVRYRSIIKNNYSTSKLLQVRIVINGLTVSSTFYLGNVYLAIAFVCGFVHGCKIGGIVFPGSNTSSAFVLTSSYHRSFYWFLIDFVVKIDKNVLFTV